MITQKYHYTDISWFSFDTFIERLNMTRNDITFNWRRNEYDIIDIDILQQTKIFKQLEQIFNFDSITKGDTTNFFQPDFFLNLFNFDFFE